MASVSFRLRSSTNNKNVSIKIRLSIARSNVLELKTGFLINPKDWNKEAGLPKNTTAENKTIFNNLKKLELYLYEHLNSDSGKGVVIDSFWLNEKVAGCFSRVEKNDEGLLTNYLQDLIDTANTRKVKVTGGYKLGISKTRLNSYISTLRIINEYQEKTKKQIHFTDVNESFCDKFTNWIFDTKKYAIHTGSKHLANLKTICLEAERKGLPVNAYAKNITIITERNEDRYIQTLSFEELQLIQNAEILGQAYNNARKWILLGCEFGQRGQDLLTINPMEDFRPNAVGMYLDVIQSKTDKSVTVPVIAPHVLEIIENDFPYQVSQQKLNSYIKKVCEIAGLNELTQGKLYDKKSRRKQLGFYEKHKLITCHSFRRSFATNYYKKIPTPVLMKITGHSKESIFLKYINQREDKDSNADLFMNLYEKMHKDKEPQLIVLKTGTTN